MKKKTIFERKNIKSKHIHRYFQLSYFTIVFK